MTYNMLSGSLILLSQLVLPVMFTVTQDAT